MTLADQPYAIERPIQTRLVAEIEQALEQARAGHLTGFSLVMLHANGTFNTISYFERRLEMLGALAVATSDVMVK